MFALFLKQPDGHLKFLNDAVNAHMAIFLGQYLSRHHRATVVGFANQVDGTTQHCCTFVRGELVGQAELDPEMISAPAQSACCGGDARAP